jgi:hypothetical protein
MMELVLILIAAVLLFALMFFQRRSPAKLRPIPALTRLYRSIGLSVEDGTRLHASIGRGRLLGASGGTSLAALSMLRYLSERTAASDRPSVATAGDAALSLLAQDTLRAGYQAAGAEDLFQLSSGRLSGLTPFSYAAGAMPVISDENASTNVLMGNFGPEVALLVEAAERVNVPSLGGSDDLSAQAVLFAATPEPLIGEELFAAGAYLEGGPAHAASLVTQDVLRWSLVGLLVLGAALKLVGAI